MKEFFNHNHEHVTLVAHHSVLPIHLLVVGHCYTVATLVATLVLVAYAFATIYHERQGRRYE